MPEDLRLEEGPARHLRVLRDGLVEEPPRVGHGGLDSSSAIISTFQEVSRVSGAPAPKRASARRRILRASS